MMTLLMLAACQDVERWIRALGSESIEERDAALEALAARGPGVAAALRARLDDADLEVATRARLLLKRIEREDLVSKLMLRVAPDGSGYAVSIVNRSSRSVLFFHGHAGSGFRVTPYYVEGRRFRCGGVRTYVGCRLERHGFLEVAPGESKGVGTVSPPDGWTVERIETGYRFSQASFKAICPLGCAGHDDPEKPWNRAMEIERSRTWRPGDPAEEITDETWDRWMIEIRRGARAGELGRIRREGVALILESGRWGIGRLVDQVGDDDLGLARGSVLALNEIAEMLNDEFRTEAPRANNREAIRSAWREWFARAIRTKPGNRSTAARRSYFTA